MIPSPRRTSTVRTARAFTLLELVLASTLGLLVLIGVVSLMFGFETTNNRLARRYESMTELQRVRLVASRAFSTMLVAPSARAQPGTGATAVPGSDPTSPTGPSDSKSKTAESVLSSREGAAGTGSKAAASGKSGSSAKGDNAGTADSRGSKEPASAPGASGPAGSAPIGRTTPRVWLRLGSPVSAAQLRDIPRVANAGTQPQRSMTQPQRLELVLSASPVPQTESLRQQITAAQLQTRREERQRARSPRDAAPTARDGVRPAPQEDDSDETQTRAIRGAFELRPTVVTGPNGRAAAKLLEDGNPVWELWWVPLPPRPAEYTGSPDEDAEYETLRREAQITGALGEEFKIASNIAWMRWQMFHERVRKLEYSGATWSDLPAYAELEIETANGMTGNWLFEISADQGAETPSDRPDSDRNPDGGAPGTKPGAKQAPGNKSSGGKLSDSDSAAPAGKGVGK